MCCERWSNEAATVHADITADHRDVPAIYSCGCGRGLSQEPQQHFNFYPVAAMRDYFRHCLLIPHGNFPRWRMAKPRTLMRECIFYPFGDYFEEIYFRSLVLIKSHMRGFSSQRVTSMMIHFLSSVISMVAPTWCHGPI